jgi:hypothetical protein
MKKPSRKTEPANAKALVVTPAPPAAHESAFREVVSLTLMVIAWTALFHAIFLQKRPGQRRRHPGKMNHDIAYPVIWTDVLTPYGVEELPDAPLAVFGVLSFWWLGEHGSPRMDTSEHMWFLNNQLAVRFIEEIDFDYAAGDATAVLLTAPAA